MKRINHHGQDRHRSRQGSLTFNPVDDAYIASDSAATNYGSAPTLEVDNSPIKDFLLKFDVTGVNGQSVANARVRLYNENSSTNGGDFYNVNDNSWQEESVTWDSAPAADTTLLASRVRAQMAKRGKQVHLA